MRGDDMSYCVYKHTCPNGKIYIGITGKNPLRRWREGQGYIHNQYFFNAILKYGWDNIKHEILFTNLTKEEACEKEIELIAEYKSNNPEFGYNLTSGGEYFIHSEEVKKKMSNAGKLRIGEKNGFYGKRHSEDSIHKMSESLKGKYCGEQHPNARKVINLETNEIFVTVSVAAKKYNTRPCHISAVCKGIRKTSGGHHWRYADE